MIATIVGFIMGFIALGLAAVVFAFFGICLIWLLTFTGITLAAMGVRFIFGD